MCLPTPTQPLHKLSAAPNRCTTGQSTRSLTMMRLSFPRFSNLSLLALAVLLLGSSVQAPPLQERIVGVNYSPFRDGQSPLTNAYPTVEQMQQDMPLLKDMANYVRTYSVHGVLGQIPALA